jgi:hypothetical protein
MDIYFCDLCGVRVTDIDLKGGHGLRRSHDVICATCLELGHGKDWLAKHSSQPRPAAIPAKSPAPAKPQLAMVAAASNRPAALLDVARDRARTADADHDHTPAVAPQVLAHDDEPAEASTESELDNDGDHEVTAKVGGSDHTNLAAAASSFSALGSSPGAAEDQAPQSAADDLEDQDQDQDHQPESPGADSGARAAEEIEQASSPFAFKQADETEASPVLVDDSETSEGEEATAAPQKKPTRATARRSAGGGKDETLPAERTPLKSDGEVAKKQSSGSNSANRKSSAKVSKTGKSNKLSGRGRSKGSNKTVMLVTCVTLPLLFLIMAYLQFSSHKSPGARKTETVNISEEVKKGIVAAKLDTTMALNASPKKLEQLDSARAQIQGIISLINSYEKTAKSKGMTDDEIERALEAAHWPDLQMLIKPLNDERAKILINK